MYIFTLEEAQAIIEAAAGPLPTERVPLEAALRRVLAEDVASDMDMPPFDKASMDGYACRRADAFGTLRVAGHIPAGSASTLALAPGECAKIMTGAPLPGSADCILIVEQIEVLGNGLVRFTGDTVRENYCAKGMDVRRGDVVLHAGQRLYPQHLAVLASIGCAQPLVTRAPRVAVIATGDEIVAPEAKPGPAQIRNSNSYQLLALVQSRGGVATNLGIVPDKEDELRAAFEKAFQENDLVLSTGGVSMGDYDLVPGVLQSMGFETHLRRVAIQPGKPVVFATREQKAFFGLSGNPVSSFVQFELLVRPLLRALEGASTPSSALRLPLNETMRRKNAERMAWVPVRCLPDGSIGPVEFHGAAHAHGLSNADGLIHFPVGCLELPQGEVVEVRLCKDLE